jgi:hypothetical protein
MSSPLKIISSEEPIMPDLTGLALIKWVLSNVYEGEFGTCCDNKVYLNCSELPLSMYEKFKEAVYKLTKNEYRGTNVLIPTETMQTLYNEPQKLGPFTKEQWVEYCKTIEFYVYVT